MSGPTLAAFFEWDPAELPDDGLAKIGQAKALARGRESLGRKPPERFWPGVSRIIARALGQALQVDLQKVLVGGWNTYRSLLEYADPAKHPPEEIGQVALGRHVISSTHKPRVNVFLNGRKLADVEFEVALELEIESAILTVQNARVKEVSVGRCTGTGTLSCEGAALVQRHTREIDFPGRLKLGEGLPIVTLTDG